MQSKINIEYNAKLNYKGLLRYTWRYTRTVDNFPLHPHLLAWLNPKPRILMSHPAIKAYKSLPKCLTKPP